MNEFENTYKVYVQTDTNGNIIAPPNSSAFLSDTTGWVQIDEGVGDKYHHAQGNYFGKPIMTTKGVYRYKLVDGKVVLNSNLDAEVSAALTKTAKLAQIETLKAQLSESDYKVIKCSECNLAGLTAPYDIAKLNAERQAIRDQINKLEATIK